MPKSQQGLVEALKNAYNAYIKSVTTSGNIMERAIIMLAETEMEKTLASQYGAKESMFRQLFEARAVDNYCKTGKMVLSRNSDDCFDIDGFCAMIEA